MLDRAYSLLNIKSIDPERRVIAGMATTPTPDRMGDIVEPRGASFKTPLPLLLHHDSRLPVGTVRLGKATDEGIAFEASFPDINEPGALKERIAEAWQSVKAGLIRGVSIGFRTLDDGLEVLKTGGYRFTKTEILELSLVAIPANAEATIQTIKSFDAPHVPAPGAARVRHPQVHLSGDSAGKRAPSTGPLKAYSMKPIAERKAAFAAEKAAKVAKLNELVGADDGVTMAPETQEQFDTITDEIKALDAQLARLETLEQVNKSTAVDVTPKGVRQDGDPQPRPATHQVSVTKSLPPGIEFAQAVIAKVRAQIEFRNAVEIAKELYPDNTRIQAYLKGAVPAANTQTSVWAGALVDPTNLASEFIEFLRPQTIIGKFGTNGIPGLRRVPFNIRVIGQTSSGEGYWVGEGAPKPLTSFQVAPTTLGWAKVANIAVITDEMSRFSSPSIDAMVRDELAKSIIERLDIDFIHPAKSASANVSPASITNDLTPLSSAGTSADNARTDIQNLLEQFILNNNNPASLVLIMPNTLALALSVKVNSLGQQEFPGLTMNGGTLMGIPVITSQYAANESGAGNLVIAVNASDIFLADDGQVTVDMSREASLQMLDNPTNNSVTATATSMVSMWQTNSIALRAERYINWAKRRASAVVYMDDVNWGSIGSPS